MRWEIRAHKPAGTHGRVPSRHQRFRGTIETICVRNTGRGGIAHQSHLHVVVNPRRFNMMVVPRTLVFQGAKLLCTPPANGTRTISLTLTPTLISPGSCTSQRMVGWLEMTCASVHWKISLKKRKRKSQPNSYSVALFCQIIGQTNLFHLKWPRKSLTAPQIENSSCIVLKVLVWTFDDINAILNIWHRIELATMSMTFIYSEQPNT